MIKLKNEFAKFKLDFEEYKQSFKKYEENHKKYLSELERLTDRYGEILTRDRKPTNRYISQAQRDIRINQKRYSSYEAAIIKIDNYMDSLEYGDNLDDAVNFINKLQSIIDSLPQKPAAFPKMDLSSTPLIQHAVLSLYNNNLGMDKKFYNLNGQYLQLSEVANETLTRMNEPQISICFGGDEIESVMIEQMAILSSKDGSPVNNNLLNAFEPSTIYGGCEIYLGTQYCY
ncbi:MULTISPECIES: hypothetical protein [Providencia]|jgi:hypothetical protein|nr:hypothetical protein [Providencia sp. PROV212]MDR2242807.1 hypothetical protein [Providencia alcalifaciens]